MIQVPPVSSQFCKCDRNLRNIYGNFRTADSLARIETVFFRLKPSALKRQDTKRKERKQTNPPEMASDGPGRQGSGFA